MGKQRKYKAKPEIIDKKVSSKYSWNDDLLYTVFILEDEHKYGIILTYNEIQDINLKKKLKYHSKFIDDYGILKFPIRSLNTVINIINNYRNSLDITLRDFIKLNLDDVVERYSAIIIYNNKDEIVSFFYCKTYGKEVYDTRNNHGVKVATSEGGFLYNFLTNNIKNIPIKALDKKIKYYVSTNKELKIKVDYYVKPNNYEEIKISRYKKLPNKKDKKKGKRYGNNKQGIQKTQIHRGE